MRMAARRNSGLLELAEMRLPLIALIDVILFLLMYFLLAGSLEAEERELATHLPHIQEVLRQSSLERPH